MTLSPSQIFVYAADNNDYSNANQLISDSAINLPVGNVIGSFSLAWTAIESGKFLVIAIGEAAHNALYSNPCNFGALGAPYFTGLTGFADTLPGAGKYMNAAGNTGDDSYFLSYNYAYYAIHGTCGGSPGCNGSPTAIDATSSCIGFNPANTSSPSFCDTCSSGASKPLHDCTGGSCDSLSTIQSTAVNSGWNPEILAHNIINLMVGTGVTPAGSLDFYAPVAAMETQGCYNSPNGCYQLNTSSCPNCTCDCTNPVVGQGYGVLQETYNSNLEFDHAAAALNWVTQKGQSQSVWFPGPGITACTLVSDPGTAFKEYYWYALSDPNNSCDTIADWIGCPCSAVSCARTQYEAVTGVKCVNTHQCNGVTC